MTPEAILVSLLTPAVVVGWLLAPYLLAFFGALVPALGEWPLLICCLATVLMALPSLLLGESISLNLIGSNDTVADVFPADGDLVGATEHPVELALLDAGTGHAVEDAGHGGDGASSTDGPGAALVGVQVVRCRQPEVGEDRGLERDDGQPALQRIGDLVARTCGAHGAP